jgi:hypothetical protein
VQEDRDRLLHVAPRATGNPRPEIAVRSSRGLCHDTTAIDLGSAVAIAEGDNPDHLYEIRGRKCGRGTEEGSCWTREAPTGQNAVPIIRHHQANAARVEAPPQHGAIIRNRGELHPAVLLDTTWARSHHRGQTRSGGHSPQSHSRLENDHQNGGTQISELRGSLSTTVILVLLRDEAVLGVPSTARTRRGSTVRATIHIICTKAAQSTIDRPQGNPRNHGSGLHSKSPRTSHREGATLPVQTEDLLI